MTLESNRFTGTVPSELGRLSLLEDLKLGSNGLIGEVPIQVCDLFAGGRLQQVFVDCDDVACTCCANC
jgi:hypothetical protein